MFQKSVLFETESLKEQRFQTLILLLCANENPKNFRPFSYCLLLNELNKGTVFISNVGMAFKHVGMAFKF